MIKMKRKYRLTDLNHDDMELLKNACFLEEESFICFGKSYYKLSYLGLINDENQVTPYGREILKEYYSKVENVRVS